VVAAIVLLAGAVPASAQETAVAAEDYIAPVDVDTLGLPGPRQPIFYRHDIHAGQYQMECRYCHFSAEVSIEPGLPTISTCLGCHQLIGSGNPEVEKLRAAALEENPPEWVRIHNLPGHVRFPHMMHVNSTDPEVTCQECHGEIERMAQVYQWASLKMGWCIDCHLENEVTTDCTACHY
jgi:hypothetical protein